MESPHYFYLSPSNESVGPVDSDEIMRLKREKVLLGDSLIFYSRIQDWIPLRNWEKQYAAKDRYFTLSTTSHLQVRELRVEKRMPRAVVLDRHIRMPDGTQKKVIMDHVAEDVPRSEEEAIRVYIRQQEEVVRGLNERLAKENGNLDSAREMLAKILESKDH